MQATVDHPAQALLQFNREVLEQAQALAAAHERPGAPAYEHPVGAHLRHVIEHYEALLMPQRRGEVDYDRRARDATLQGSAHVARQRLHALQRCLQQACSDDLRRPLLVRGQAGLAGEFAFVVDSSLGRELVFLASHAVHHFALLKTHCLQHGIALAADFGKAPATVRHERTTPPTTATQEVPCPTPALAA